MNLRPEWKSIACGASPDDCLLGHPNGLACHACYKKLPPPPREWLIEQSIQHAIDLAEIDDE